MLSEKKKNLFFIFGRLLLDLFFLINELQWSLYLEHNDI